MMTDTELSDHVIRRRGPSTSISSTAYKSEYYEDDEEWDDSVERIFEGTEVPSWGEQLTFRAFGVSIVMAFFLSFVVMKLNLTTGIIPSLNICSGLLGFFLLKTWTKALENFGLLRQPFTRQENTVIQTCVVAAGSVSFSGGFGSYLLGMSSIIAKKQSEDDNVRLNIKNPSLGWVMVFVFVVSFVGLFSVVSLRKIMILNYKLPFASGAATAHLINSFHTPEGAIVAKRQVAWLFKSFGASFFWSFFQWFYNAGDNCGFPSFPSLGLAALKKSINFDFCATYIGVGMICPHTINITLLVGSLISWLGLWSYIESKEGIWYTKALKSDNLKGLQGYKVFIPIAMLIGDGLYHFIEVLIKTGSDIYSKQNHGGIMLPITDEALSFSDAGDSYDERRRKEYFLKDEIPNWLAILGYIFFATLAVIILPHIIPQLRPYHIITAYIIAPPLAFCNAYGTGLTDWSLASGYGKLTIFIFGSWVGMENGGILAGLASCGIMVSIVTSASDLIQDFKTGYMTLASPRSMFIGQVIGTAMGCVIAPSVYMILYHSFKLGDSKSDYPAPFASVYRGIAIISTEGLSALPKHCINFCAALFAASVALNCLKAWATYKQWWFSGFVPSPVAMAVPFFMGSFFTIDMCVGSLIRFLWERTDRDHAEAFVPAVASGLICGDGIWTLPMAFFSVFKLTPPICMKFLSKKDNIRVDKFLNS